MSSAHKATLRKSLQSALAHRRLANELLDSILDTQQKFNAAMAKLDADAALTLDIDYASTLSVTDLFEADTAGSGQHKATLRQSLRSALMHKRLADEIADALEEMQVAYNALLVKLDAEAGVLNDVDYASTLAVTPIDPDSSLSGQHQSTMRRTLEVSLAHSKLADTILDSIKALQDSFNSALKQLDTSVVTASMAGFQVTENTPDQN